jgi:ribonucleoside-diphosphate reductase alpha chain
VVADDRVIQCWEMTAIELTGNARRALDARYLRRDSKGRIADTAGALFWRVADAVAAAERRFAGAQTPDQWRDRFFELLCSLEFLPNSPTLMNAGSRTGQFCACFVLPVEDSLEAIFESLKRMALIQQSGGGTGFSFSSLRPRGDPLASTGGTSSGPVSFMRIFDCATENIRQGGKRQGANMGILRVDHPDILEFIDAKRDGRSFRNFNLSVAVTDEFLQAAEAARPFPLRHPRTGAPAGSLPAAEVLDRMAQAAWETGDPGLVFLDAINRANPTPALGAIAATNPCGEVPLLPHEACVLGSINLIRMIRRSGEAAGIDWDKLASTTRAAVRFLDNVIEVNRWPTSEIAWISRGNRKIGLGVMGFADLLLLLGVPYASDAAVELAEEISRRLAAEALAASEDLARERGEFPNWGSSVYAARGQRVRNATRTSIAPTGTISLIAGTSAGIEPLFALAYRHEHVLAGQTLTEWNPLFRRHLAGRGLPEREILERVAAAGALAGVEGIPADLRELFRTALEISPEHHLRVQAAFQKHVDNAVSKTINLPASASADEIRAIFLRAWKLELKGVTVYRYGSKAEQVLSLGSGQTPEQLEHFVRCDPEVCRL